MLIDGVRFDDAAPKSSWSRGVSGFLAFIERKLGISALFDKRRIPFGRLDLSEPLQIASKLFDNGVIERYGPAAEDFPDEPPIRLWSCRLNDTEHIYAAGASVDDDKAAFTAALAESLERYIWTMQRDYFRTPVRATTRELAARAPLIAPERFAGFSEEQRSQDPRLALRFDAAYLWIRGTSLVTGKPTYVPAQQVSAAYRSFGSAAGEPLIRKLITNGLATWPTEAGARLAGALECIEREAYMVMWFNQLTLPRANLSSLRKRSASLDTIVARCEKYRLKVHIVPLLTDAPTHVACAVIEDESPLGPRFVLGLKSHRSLARAAEGAILEALRARRFTRRDEPEKYYDPEKSVDRIGHRGRVYYWAIPEHAKHLEFLVKGELKEVPEAAWEHDTIEQQLKRVVDWCRSNNYEFVSIPLGGSKKNPTRWYIEMVVMPELQPTHLTEEFRHLGGTRLKSVPEKFGYTPRATPFIERPHPYC
jgi:ribosomal protein S12 methylthiotransferase accessory factor